MPWRLRRAAKRGRQRGILRDGLLAGAGVAVGSSSLLAQATAAMPGMDLATIITQGGVLGAVIYLLVQSYRERLADAAKADAAKESVNALRLEEAKGYAADLKEVAAEQAKQQRQLLDAVLARLPAVTTPDPMKEDRKR